MVHDPKKTNRVMEVQPNEREPGARPADRWRILDAGKVWMAGQTKATAGQGSEGGVGSRPERSKRVMEILPNIGPELEEGEDWRGT